MEKQDHCQLSQEQQNIMDSMKQWLYQGGSSYEKLKVVDFKQNYRGVITTEQIKKNETIVFVPKTHFITLQLAKQSTICQTIISKKIQFCSPKHTYMAIYLLEQYRKGKQSKWKDYIEILPKNMKSFPIHFSTQELTQLIGSALLPQIHQKVLDLKKDYDNIYQNVEEFRVYTFGDFIWSRTIIGSRIFGVYINGIKTEILVPFADMLNHRIPKYTSWNYNESKEGFAIVSLENLKKGQQIFDSYGKKCNSRYLLNYGFVTENNPENQICIRAEINDNLKERKFKMIKKPNGEAKILRISKRINENNFFESMGYLRFRNIDTPDTLDILEKISGIKDSNQPYIPSKTPPINMRLQIIVWQDFKKLCEDHLSQYAISLQKDQQLLENQKLSENMKNIILLRSGQKIIYKFYIEISKQVIQILNLGFEEAVKKINQQKFSQNVFSRYLLKTLSLMPHQKKSEIDQIFKEIDNLEENEQIHEEQEEMQIS